jgi:hypothetical protein
MNDRPELHLAYFETRFRVEGDWRNVPAEFAIVTAFATTGQTWTDHGNQAADERLRAALEQLGTWIRRATGYSPTTGHREPGWAVEIQFNKACEIGLAFQQDAVYYIRGGEIYVSRCDRDARREVHMASWAERVEYC